VGYWIILQQPKSPRGSLRGGSNVEVGLDCLTEESSKKIKAPLEELRAWLELRSSQGSADIACK
jgi:hypothetical protein